MKNHFYRIVIVMLITHYGVAAFAEDNRYNGPGFSATKVSVDGSDKQISQIYMNKKGFREELLTNTPVKSIYISNYRLKKTWMVIPFKKIYSDMATMPGHQQSTFTRSTMFDTTPCKGFNKTKKLAIKNIQNQQIEEWGCINTQSQDAILQWFNPKTKMVIREQDKSGDLGDITISNIKFKQQPNALFELPGGYKEISMQKMMLMMQQP